LLSSKLLDILLSSAAFEGRKARIANALPATSGIGSAAELVNEFQEADMVLIDVEGVVKRFGDLVGVDDFTLLIVKDAVSGIYKHPTFSKELGAHGFMRSLLPVGEGLALFIKRGFSPEFFKRTIEVYRDSFIQGPNPVDYNTAYALYILTKFVLSRRRGMVLEVGTGRGFSTMWLGHAAKEVGAPVVSIDSRCDRVDYAKKIMGEVGLDNVEVLCTDAKEYKQGEGEVVLAFIDGKKDEYHLYLRAIEPLLIPGAVLLAHNTLSNPDAIKPYIEKVYAPPYRSLTVATDPKGLTITVYGPRS